MKQIKITLIGTLAVLVSVLTSSVAADTYGIGVKGAVTQASTSGNEVLTESATRQSGSAQEVGVVPSIFLEYNHDAGYTVGLEYIPMEVELGAKTSTRSDWTSASNTTDSNVSNKVEAELADHLTLYVEKDFGGAFFKGGVSSVKVKTKENLGTGSSYGDKTVFGGLVGIGYKATLAGNAFYKVGIDHTNYQSVRLESDAGNVVNAQVDTTAGYVAVGMAF
jgi:hypothetical protein